MKKLDFTVLAFAGLLCLISLPMAHAANRAGSATFTLGAGNYYFSSRRHIDNTGFPFAALGYNFTDQWGLEGLFAVFNTDSNRPEDNGKQVKGALFALDAIYHFSPYRIMQPFVLAGVGALGLNPNGTDADNQGNINAGVGAQFFANESVAFRIEARDFYTIVGGKNDVFLDAGVTFLLDIC
ncbi:OmpA family protein [Aquicella lusitana]|uniref:OprF-like membrane protein n=1 Tax=Aquicella lusitana TaxID=254246 RepID=A0A370GLF8_9COXI|nr:OmpA family protein [Aquicella lusitana]RDI42723.1 OprF-like membrane protein [Aquicella lusitana]VVC73422.1 hypothetical protein AQULUS_11610 [Aquicella lusitana]